MGQPSKSSGFSEFVAEMRRRHVVRFALAYAAAAFVILQLAEIVFEPFGVGEGGLRLLVVVIGLGFLPALVLAWIYDVTSEGIRRTDEGDTDGMPSRVAIAALLITTVVVTGGVGAYLTNTGVLSVDVVGDSDAGPILTVAYDPAEPIRSVAVLPLDDYSPAGDQAYFTAGMHEELIAKLGLLDDVRVVSRSTAMRYADDRPPSPQIGRELSVDALIEGSVTRDENRVRLTLTIIHAASDTQIESLQWEREQLADVLAFQTEVARDVADAIHADHEHTDLGATLLASNDPEAQDAFLRAKHEYDRGTPEGLRMAVEYFEQALQEDPDFAQAMAGLAGARFMVGMEEPETSEDDLALAYSEALQALEMDSSSMEAREVLTLIQRSLPENIEGIVVEAPLAGVDGQVITIPGSFDPVEPPEVFGPEWETAMSGIGEATTSIGERVEVMLRRRGVSARGGPREQTARARALIGAGEYMAAAEMLEGVVQESPESASAWEMLARSHAGLGNADGAAGVITSWHETGVDNAPDANSVARLSTAIASEGEVGYWGWHLDRLERDEAEGRRVPRMELALTHAALGNSDEALVFLTEAIQNREPGVGSLRTDPVWDDYRSDPRFQEMVRRARTARFAPGTRGSRGGSRGG